MKQVDRTKVCWSCEADVSHEATYCPFCGTDLLTSTIKSGQSSSEPKDKKFIDQSLQESLASLYKPPYSVRNRQGIGIPDEREETTFKEAAPKKEDPLFQPYEQIELEEQASPFQENHGEEEITRRGNILPLLFLMIGIHLLVLGMLLLFCSKNGVVTLQWSSRPWFLYCLFSLPLLYFGKRMLKTSTSG